MNRILGIKSFLINKSNEDIVYDILDPLFRSDVFYVVDGVDEEKELRNTARKKLEEIGEFKIIEEFVNIEYD